MYPFIINFTFVFTPYVLEPHALCMMTPWKLTSCGFFNKCAVCMWSGRSVGDQQPDFPRDNSTGSLLPPSLALQFLLDSTYSAMGIQRWSGTFYSTLFPGYSKAPLWNQASAGVPSHYLSVKTARRTRQKYLACVMRSREKKWTGCNIGGITTKPAI